MRFGSISGLRANMQKCTAFKIRCEDQEFDDILDEFGGAAGVLPCKYLGLPLSVRKPRRIEIQPLLDRAAARVPPWKGKLFNRAGRLALVNSTLTAILTYYLTCFALDKWAIKRINKIRRSFLWAGDEEANGGKCLVNWQRVCSPKRLGGLGIKDVAAYGRALRLRWLWYEWDVIARPWKGTQVPCDDADRRLFAACTTITLGNGHTASFWESRWLHGESPREIAPDVQPLAWRKNLTVREALTEGRWMAGLQRISTAAQLDQFVALWHKIRQINLSEDHDAIRWHLAPSGVYSAKSAYDAQFFGRIPLPALDRVWKQKIEQKVKFYLWLLLQNRNWTADRLEARGWPHGDECSLCDQVLETASHLLLECPFAREVWHLASTLQPRVATIALSCQTIGEWWKKTSLLGPKPGRIKECRLAAYVAWHLWKERNRRIFHDSALDARAVFSLVRDDLNLLEEAFWE